MEFVDVRGNGATGSDSPGDATGEGLSRFGGDHVPVSNQGTKRAGQLRCVVCAADKNLQRMKDVQKYNYVDLKRAVSTCRQCNISAHTGILKTGKRVHTFPAFQNKTCFEIAHSDEGKCIWRVHPETNRLAVMIGLGQYQQLREYYGLPKKRGKKNKGDDTNGEVLVEASMEETEQSAYSVSIEEEEENWGTEDEEEDEASDAPYRPY